MLLETLTQCCLANDPTYIDLDKSFFETLSTYKGELDAFNKLASTEKFK